MDGRYLNDSGEKINKYDRLSNLPDKVIHRILSAYFDNETISGNMLAVSKKLRRLNMTSSSMGFVIHIHNSLTSVNNFHNYLSNLLFSVYEIEKRPPNPLRKLSLSWRKGRQNTLYCQDSIPEVVRLPSLECLVIRYFGLDLRGFSSIGELISEEHPHLKKLVLYFENCGFSDALIINIGTLKELELTCINCTCVAPTLAVKIDCPYLEHLTLKNLKFSRTIGEITVLTEQLKTLVVDQVEFSYQPHCFKIHAPQLRSFYWKGSPIMVYWCKETFPLLQEAVINVTKKDNAILAKNFLSILLSSVQHAKQLEVQQPKSSKVFGLYARRYISCW